MATLFQKLERGKLTWMLQVVVPGLGRKTVRLGAAPQRAAERFRDKVEDLVGFKRLNLSPDAEITKWVAGLDEDLHAALVSIGLAEPRERGPTIPTLKAFAERYIESKRPELAERSIALLEDSSARLMETVGESIPIDKVTPGMALDWRAGLLRKGLSEAYVRMHSRNAKSLFNEAIRRDLLTKNPFKVLPTAAIAADRSFYLSEAAAEQVLEKLEGGYLKLFFGLMRYGGLRAPSETHILTWGQIDLSASRMTVYAPKTGQTRTVPVVPRLRELFEAVRPKDAEPGDQVLRLSLHNLHKKVLEGIEAAGLDRWDDLFQTLRRAAASDFAKAAPPHAVASWMGHGIHVSAQHYLQVPEEMFERVTGPSASRRSRRDEMKASSRPHRKPVPDRSALQNALQHGGAEGCISLQTQTPLKLAGSGDAA